MAKKEREKIMLAEHLMEVRHVASGSFLDVRGYVADYIRNSGILPHWKIDANVVTFRDMPDNIKLEGAFAGYKSAGYVVHNPETRNFFIDRASTFWRKLIKNDHYTLPPALRFGSRTKVFLPSEKSFEEINKVAFETLYTQKAQEIIGGKETDLQLIINFMEGQFEARLAGGPVHENEVSNHLSFESEHFKRSGFFIDLDYYKTKDINHDVVPKLLKEAIELTWIKVDKIAVTLGL